MVIMVIVKLLVIKSDDVMWEYLRVLENNNI
jgi:hypothetical protein